MQSPAVRLEKRSLQVEAEDAGEAVRVALSGDHLALAFDGRVDVFIDALRTRLVKKPVFTILGWEPVVSLSSSGRHAAVVCATREPKQVHDVVELWDLVAGQRSLHLKTPDHRKAEAAILYLDGREVFLVSYVRSVLEAYALPERDRILFSDFREGVVFDGFQPAGYRDSFVAFWHFASEGKDSLVVFSLSDLVARQGENIIPSKEPLNEYSERVAAGPAGPGEIVVFRDDWDEEEYEEDEEDEFAYFTGFEFRRLSDAQVVHRIAYDAPIESHAPLFAVPSAIVMGCPGRVDILRYGEGQPAVESIPARCYGFDTVNRRFAVATESGGIDVYGFKEDASQG